MPDPSPDGQERLARFLAILIHESGEDRLAYSLYRVNEDISPDSLSVFSLRAGAWYVDELLNT